MYPGCRFMDLHPQQRDKVSYATHYGPGFEPVSPQIKMDAARPPVNYEHLPCYGSYGYPHPYPLPYHGCYHNSYVPDYHGYGPHYPHYAPPAPVYTHGSYPPHPGYPFQYPPPLHYPVADPRYEYDKKGVGDHHCCGCPNHLWQQKENKNVKIEEHTSDDEKDRVALSGPSELNDSSYPVLWIPPGYKWNEEGTQAMKSESKEEEKKGCDKEVNERLKSFAQEPGFWNGWLPINLNNLNSLIKEGDEKGPERRQNEDKKNLPPVGWMPYKSEQEEKSEHKDGDQKFIWDPSHFRMFPLKFLENQDKKGIPMDDKGNHEHSSLEDGPKMGDKNVVQKIVPVKQMDQSEVKGLSKDGPKTGDKKFVQKIIPVQQMDRTVEKGISKIFENPIPVKPMDQTEEESISKVEKKTSNEPLKRTDKKGDGKHLDNNGNGQSSTSKASKLPPVCLRVDPLPSRRNKSGSSRSLSPPANRRKSEELSLKKSYLSSTGQGNKQQDMQCSVDDSTVQNIKSEDWKKVPSQSLKNVSVSEDCKEVPPQSPVNVTADEDQKEVPSHSPVDESLHKVLTSCQSDKGDQDCTVGDNGVINVDMLSGEVTKDEKLTSKDGEVTKAGDSTSETGSNGGPIYTAESSVQCTNRPPNHRFSEAEAAVIIQSAYRGFEVRRWEPLKKLKEIAKIKGELIKIKEDVQKLVSSGSASTDKQRIVIGETIMNLLLQLDTMQGLHPSVRNIRKSVAKELVSLQEELDALIIQNSEELKESEKSKHDEKIPKSAGVESGEHAGGNRHEQEISSTSQSDSVEPILGQPLTVTDVNTSYFDAKNSELMCAELPDPSDYEDSNKHHLEPLIEVDGPIEMCGIHEVNGPSEMHGLHKDVDSLQVDSHELPPSAVAEGKLNSAVQLQNISSLVESDQTAEDDFGEVNIDMSSGASKQDSEAQVPCDGLQDDGGECVVGPGDLVLRGNEAKETIVEEQWQEKMMQKDNNDADQKADTDAEGYSKILVNDAKETSTEEKQFENLLTESLNVSGLKDSIAATEEYLEGSSEPKDDISAGDSERDEKLSGEAMVELEKVEASKAKDDGDIKDVVNACEVETDDQQTNNMQGTDTLLLEKNEMPDVNEVGNDVEPVDDMQPVDIFGPEANDISVATTDSEVKQPTVCTINKQEESPMEEIANCNMAHKMVVDEVWEDKFDNQEVSHGHCDDSIVDLPIQVEMVGEELVSEQPHQEVPASSPISGPISSCTGTESDQNLAVENNNSSGTKIDSDQKLALENKISSDTETDQKLAMENEKLRETVEKLIAAGKEQLTAISSLSGRVKDLEKKLSRKKKLKMRKHKPSVGLLCCHIMEGETSWVSHSIDDIVRDMGEFDSFSELSDEVNNEVTVSVDLVLPDDLLERILAYLPIASIFRVGCVCKRWHEVVSSRRFLWNFTCVQSHKPWYFMFTSSDEPVGYAYDPILRKWYGIELPCIGTSSWFIASSCGLVCFMDNDSRNGLYICNPITRHYRKLEEPPGLRFSDYSALAISVNKVSCSYSVSLVKSKQVPGNFFQCELSIHVYDSGTRMWDTPLAEILTDWRGGEESVICNGVLYLLIYSTGGGMPESRHGLLTYSLSSRLSHGLLMRSFISMPCSLTCGRLMNLKEKLVMVGGIGKQDRPGIIKGIGIWVLSGKEWQEIGRMPHKFFQGFGEFDDVFASSGTDDLIYIQSYGAPALLVFDFNQKQWKWSQKCPVTKRFPLQLFTGFCFEPRLEIAP